MLTSDEVVEVFVNTPLEEEYNFLQEDLTTLANAFIKAAAPAIARVEREKCIDVVRSLNGLVADKLEEVRGRG